ncbi:fused DSP-PTPase phosphatase/NAD kinase-like protein [Candidatus Protochlamydia phocaeensis]|uniref:phosphatase domain-containing putative toxin n=1 Tax=Candidatus Protochlamydia phocaeensis TaxID=1414722 RepID=UPI000838973E|nr:hypothetical protein [Candidatus Protochlamydia phocaeensis]
MKSFIFTIILALSSYLIGQSFLCPSHPSLYPIFDPRLSEALPSKWRTMAEADSLVQQSESISLEGLTGLQASGSAQFSEESFLSLVCQVPTSHLVVLDLREESHGLINGLAVSWTDGKANYGNKGKSLEEVEADEQRRLQLALQSGTILIDPHGKSYQVEVKEVKTERELIESFGFTYIRLPVTDHHRPSDQAVDQFIALVKALPSNSWIHFHCKGGKGRTTTFMALYDMMLNATKVRFEDILDRQKALRGSDLFDLSKPDSYKQEPAVERLRFVRDFYTYCRQVPDFRLSWSEWVAQQSAPNL